MRRHLWADLAETVRTLSFDRAKRLMAQPPLRTTEPRQPVQNQAFLTRLPQRQVRRAGGIGVSDMLSPATILGGGQS